MNERFYLLSEGYLYTPWNGKIKELKCEVWHRNEYVVMGYIEP